MSRSRRVRDNSIMVDDCDEPNCSTNPYPAPSKKLRARKYTKTRHYVVPSRAIRAEGMQREQIKNLIQEIHRVRNVMNRKDPYALGYHNGLVRALSLLTGKEPHFIHKD